MAIERPRVFIVQVATRRNPATGLREPKFDTAPAEQFGDLVELLSPTCMPYRSAEVIGELHDKLSSITAQDYILLTGNPCLMGWTVAVASAYCSTINLLQWSSQEKRYVWIKSSLAVDAGER